MTPFRRLAMIVTALAGGLALPLPTCRAQVAFQPGVSSFPDGVVLSTVPVVSADRRYVRLGVAPQFTGLQGFDAVSVPAAVAGMNGIGGMGNNFGGLGFVPQGGGANNLAGIGYDPTASAFLSGRMGAIAPPSLAARAFAEEEQRRAAARARPRRKGVARKRPAGPALGSVPNRK